MSHTTNREEPADIAGLTVLTEAIGGSPLSQAAQSGSLPADWLAPRPQTSDEWTRRGAMVAEEFGGRGWYDALQPAINASGAARERLERIVREGGVLVTTGQQPGLFGGAILTLAKALTARALADEIERQTGRAAAPLFWAATDDADFDEASTIWLPGPTAREITIADRAAAGTPMASTPIGAADLAALLAALEHSCGSAANQRAVAAVRRAYHREATIGGAYVALLRELFEAIEIPVLDASHDAVRSASRELHERALSTAEQIETALAQRGRAIRTSGFEPQVVEVQGLTLVFAHEEGMKRRMRVTEATTDRWKALALSPTVLLRPVVERSILPTVAYVGGPAEIAYFAQVGAVATALQAPMPLVVPRWSTTLIERRVAAALVTLDIGPDDLRNVDATAHRLAKARIPDASRAALDDLATTIREGFRALARADRGPLVSSRARDGAEAMLLARLARLERRYSAAIRRQDDQLARTIETAGTALFPGGKRQERAHAFLPYLARYGSTLLDRMLESARSHARSLVGREPASRRITTTAGS